MQILDAPLPLKLIDPNTNEKRRAPEFQKTIARDSRKHEPTALTIDQPECYSRAKRKEAGDLVTHPIRMDERETGLGGEETRAKGVRASKTKKTSVLHYDFGPVLL